MLELTWKRNPHFVHKERIVFRLGHCCGEIFFLSVMFDTWGKTAGLSILESLQNEMGCWGIWTVLYGWKGQLFPLSLMEEWQGLSSCVPVSSWKGLGEAEGMAEMRPVVLTNVMEGGFLHLFSFLPWWFWFGGRTGSSQQYFGLEK